MAAPKKIDGQSVGRPVQPKDPARAWFPNEILHLIIMCFKPDNPKGILPPGDERTKTLLSAALTCKPMYLAASKVIREHCVYIDTHSRLKRFIFCLRNHSPPSFIREDSSHSEPVKKGLRATSNMFLRPFPLDPHPYPDGRVEPDSAALETLMSLARRDMDRPMEEILAQFLADPHRRTAVNVGYILNVCGDALRHLVVDLPLRFMSPPHRDRQVYDDIMTSLQRLRKLETFVIMQDERYFRAFPQWPVVTPPPNWRNVWAPLLPLLYYNPLPDRHADIWMDMNHVPYRELAIFMGYGGTAKDGLESKLLWLEHANTAAEPHVGQDGRPQPVRAEADRRNVRHRNLTVVSVDAHRDNTFVNCPLHWDFVGPSLRVRSLSARKVEVLRPDSDSSGGAREVKSYFRHFPQQTWDPEYIQPLTNSVALDSSLRHPDIAIYIRWAITRMDKRLSDRNFAFPLFDGLQLPPLLLPMPEPDGAEGAEGAGEAGGAEQE